MKLKDLERILIQNGYWVSRYSKHVIWTNGKKSVAIPQHKELNRHTANYIIKHL